ncbi:MAG: substrate-binding domain-containing protein, partial [Thermoproteota archaeon]
VDNTGLLSYLKSHFEAKYRGINLTWVCVGTGQAVEIGKRGDADVILVHNRALEDQFIKEGYGMHGVTIAYNDFIVVGPIEDPANVTGAKSIVEAFERVFNAGEAGKTLFISRGDASGTHLRELEIWNKTKLIVEGKQWYRETGSSMAATLRVANQLQGYTITDRGTWLSMEGELSDLKILFENDPFLLNLYRIVLINPEKYRSINYDAAEKLVLFLTSSDGQNLIGNYTKNGLVLFNPVFGKLKELGVYDPYEDEQVTYWGGKLKNAG